MIKWTLEQESAFDSAQTTLQTKSSRFSQNPEGSRDPPKGSKLKQSHLKQLWMEGSPPHHSLLQTTWNLPFHTESSFQAVHWKGVGRGG